MVSFAIPSNADRPDATPPLLMYQVHASDSHAPAYYSAMTIAHGIILKRFSRRLLADNMESFFTQALVPYGLIYRASLA